MLNFAKLSLVRLDAFLASADLIPAFIWIKLHIKLLFLNTPAIDSAIDSAIEGAFCTFG